MNKQIIFVDASVQDYQSLIKDSERAEIVILDDKLSAIDRITKVLADRKDIEAVHILSHGSSGNLKLGSDTLNNQTLDEFSNQIQQWGKSLTENADILLYGCDVGAEQTGLQFVQKLNQLTGADIAASDDKTGNKALGGDWNLEVKTGNIETSLAVSSQAQTTYNGILGIQVVKDINAGSGDSFPTSLTIANNTLHFFANDNVNGTELWKSDGTAGGTVLVKDIYPGIGGGSSNITAVNNILYFSPNEPIAPYELWKSDGTPGGTGLVKDIYPGTSNYGTPQKFANVNGTLYFVAYDATNGGELWKSDGTNGGKVVVKDIYPGSTSSNPFYLTNVNGTLYFMGNDGINGYELWKSDGTAGGTVLVKDILPGVGASGPSNLTNVNGTLYFKADDGINGAELWKSDGTAAGTVLVKDIYPGSNGSSFTPLTNINNTLYFSAYDPTNGGELWKTDGTTAGTVIVKDINPGSGTGGFSAIVANVNDTLYFTGNDGTTGLELWKTDGTTAGTVFVKDINPGINQSYISELTNLNGTLYFKANDGTNGYELWKSDGTTAGTKLVTDFIPGGGGADPTNLINLNDSLYFRAFTPTQGNELLKLTPSFVTAVSATTANGGYGIGQTINVTATFNEPVTVDTTGGTPRLQLATGTINQYATYTSGSGTDTLTFNYVVQANDASTDLEYLATNSLELNSGTITADGIDTILTLPALGSAQSLGGSKNLVIDTIVPTVSGISSSTPDGAYTVGQVIPITAQFNEVVSVTGTPQFTLDIGGVGRVLNYTSGSGSNTLAFNYTVAAGDTAADLDYLSTSALGLNGGAIKDSANNNATLTLPAPGAANSLGANKALVIDAVIPTLANITSTTTDGTYTVGQVIPVTTQFSEIVNVIGTPQLTLATGGAGTVLNYAGGSNSNTLTFNYTVATGDASADLDYLSTTALALNGGAIADSANNNANLTLPSPGATNSLGANKALVIDAVIPTITSITSTTSDGTYTVGQVIPITTQFSEPVSVTGTPQLTLATGGAGTALNYASGSGSNALTFNYTVAAGHTSADLDYLSTTAFALNGGAIADSANNNANLTLPSPGATNSLSANKGLVIDAVIPTITNITSTTSDGTYTVGQAIPITVQFNEPVNVSGTPQLTLATGGAGTALNYASGSGTNTLTFNYTVAAGHTSTDLDYLSNSALALNGGAIADTANNNANLTLPTPAGANSLAANKNIAIDTTPLTVTINQDPGQPDPTAGSTINFAAVFSKPVTGFDSSDIAIGGTAGATGATVTQVGGTGTLYNIATTGMSAIGTVTATINPGGATDVAGNSNTASSSTDNQVTYDNTSPTSTGINRVNPNINNSPTVNYTASFSENVTGVDVSDFTLATTGGVAGASIASVTPVSGSSYTVNVNTGSGDGTLQLNLTDDDSIQNTLLVPIGGAGVNNGSATGQIYTLDKTVPTLSNVTSTNANGTYGIGQVIAFPLTFSEVVQVTGTPKLNLNNGGFATYAAGNNTNALTFNYTVAAGESTADLDYASTTALDLSSGTVKDLATNDANPTLAAPGAAGSIGANKDILIDATAATITNITSTLADGNYTIGQVVPIAVTFDESVNVTGTPQLTLNTGGTATYASGSGTNTVTFNYIVTAGQNTTDLDQASVSALSLNGGTIKDVANNDATLTVPAPGAANSLGGNKNIAIDTTAPTISNITSTLADGSYTTGQVIPIALTLSENVNVIGTPKLALNSGIQATYTSGSGTNTLSFDYTVAAGQNIADLDYANAVALSLSGGTIKDAFNNNATLNLPVPGAANSLGANKNITIDTTAPAIAGVNSTLANGNYTVGQVVPIDLSFNESVNVTGAPRLTLNTGAIANYASGSGTNTLTFNHTVASGQNTTDLDYQNATALALNGGTIQDKATNNATINLAAPGAVNSLGANKNIAIDTIVPTISGINSTLPNGNYPIGQVIPLTVGFSENVNVIGTPAIALNNGGIATYASGSGGNPLTFNYTVGAGQNTADLDYANANALSLNGGTINDASTNNAALTLATPGAANSLGANKAIAIDATVPAIANVTATISDGNYTLGQVVPIAIAFNESVKVAGTPTLALNNGGIASYAYGSGTNTLTFNHTIGAGQNTADLDYASANALALNSGTIKDTVGNNAKLTLPTPGAAASLGANKAIVINTTAPTITNVTSSAADASLVPGQLVGIDIFFSKNVNVTGTPKLALNSGGTADYAGGSGTNTLRFNYTIAAGQKTPDLDYASASALSLNGGTIKDIFNNNATLNLPAPGTPNSLGANKNLSLFDVTFTEPEPTPTINANIRLDGVDDYIKIAGEPTFDITNALTVEGWFKVDSWTKPWQSIITKGDTAWRISRAGESNNLEFAIGSDQNTQYVQSTKAVNDGNWHHVAAVYDGSTMKLYIDGALDGQKTAGGPIPTNDFDVWIGANAQVPGRNFAGQLDEFRVWNVARPQSKITANMSRSIDNATPGLLGYWKFDESTGTTITDSSGGDNNGTLSNSNGTSWQENSSPVASTQPNSSTGGSTTPSQQIGFATWNQLDTLLTQVYRNPPLSPLTKKALKSIFDIFETGETDPANTITATGEFNPNQIELSAVRDSVEVNLANLMGAVNEFTNLPVPIPTSWSKYGVSLPLTEPTLSISELNAAPIYEFSTRVKFPANLSSSNNFLKFIENYLDENEFTLKAEVNTAVTGLAASLTASLDLDETIFKADAFELAFAGGELSAGIELGKPSVTLQAKVKLRNYDPTQDNEPELTLSGLIGLEPEAFTGGLKLNAGEAWKNPFGIPDTEFRNFVFEAGGSYAPPYFDNFKVLGDLKFGNYNVTAGFAVDPKEPKKNAILLTVNDPLSLLDLFGGPVRSFALKQVADNVGFIQDGLNLLNSIVDLKVVSLDSDNDGDPDPLIRAALFATSIGEEKIQPGLSINGKLTAWGKEATLMLESNPFNPDNPSMRGSLKIENIDWGFLKLSGATQPNLSFAFDASRNGIYFGGNAKLDIFGRNVGTIDASFTPSQININRFNWDLGVLGVELNSLKFNPRQFNGSGSGKVKLFGQEIAKGSFALNNGNLSVAGRLGVNVLGQDFGVNVRIGLGQSGNSIRLDTSAFGKNVTLVDLSLDPFVNKFKNIGDITSLIKDLFRDQIKAGVNSVTSIFGFRLADGYIANSTVFFDGNFNGLLDTDEPFTISNPDGSFDLIPELEKFDKNQDGKIDSTEGKYVASGGTDISTSLEMATPLSAVITSESKMITPLTTIITELAQQGIDPKTGQTQILAALGLRADVDLASYDPLEAIANNDGNGVAVFAAMIMVQNTIVQTAKFIDGVSEMPLEQLASGPIAAIANQLKGGTPVDFGKVETILAIVQDAITQAAQKEPTINPSQLAPAAAAAAQIVALGNQIVKDLVASGRPIKDIALEITKLQSVSVGQIAVGLPELAAGVVTVEQFLAQNTKEAILSRIAKAQVNDPTFRPGRETASENALVPLEFNSDNTNSVTQIDSSASRAIEINTPKISLIDRGDQTNLPQNQLVNGNYLLTDGDDNEIPLAAFSQPIFGLSGNDNLMGSDNNDTIHGNKGADAIDGGNGDDNLFGGKQSDQLSGGSGDDFLSGNNENDTLTGGDGNDRIRGGKENDVLIGGNGDDELWGDKGFDVLTGGAGKDNFVLQYTASNPAFADVILDFSSEDKIKLVGATFSQLTFESVNIILDGTTAVASTAIKSGNNYLGVVYNLNPTALNSSSFL